MSMTMKDLSLYFNKFAVENNLADLKDINVTLLANDGKEILIISNVVGREAILRSCDTVLKIARKHSKHPFKQVY